MGWDSCVRGIVGLRSRTSQKRKSWWPRKVTAICSQTHPAQERMMVVRETPITYEPAAIELLGGMEEFFDRKLKPKLDVPSDIDWRAQKIKDFLDDHLVQGRQKLDDVCKQLGLSMSARQARRLFKEWTGIGIRDYTKNRRLAAAVTRLELIETPIKVIAAEVGFRSPRQFRRHFKEFFGISPVEFRRVAANREFSFATLGST